MACAQCGFENREGKRFCVECGAALARRCPGCATEVEPSEKFCGECGTALAGTPATPIPAPMPAAVRKTVTVLFADLSGSTGFGERNDAEISRQVLARYHALLQETVDAHAGTVAKFMGDGMMATWGIPEVSEDDARRAVAAGVALQVRFEEFAADVERRHGERLALRVGINTGEVVIGEGDADLIGDALNVAARLEKACRPGHVLVGGETWRLTRGEVGYEALGEVTVAGRAQPVAIYEVAAETETEPEVAAPFVGRKAELQRLVDVFDDACRTSEARLTTVLGSPGVGKTRLSRELCAHLAEHGDAQRVELRCDRAGEATFAPVAQLVRDASGISDDLDADAARGAIGTLLPESEADHARVVDVLAGIVGVGPARSVEETFWGVRRLVEATAAVRPLVVVIDDIQWAEPLLLDLIEHLAEWVADAAVLLVGLARPELREVRPSLAEPGRPVAAVVVLDGLDASATEALAAGLLGTARLPAGLVERLPASTDGNPLFVRELVRMLVDDQVIRRRDDGAWELTIDAEAVDVPPTIQSLLGARVERLPAAEREVLEYASVVGAEFSLGALRELAGERAPLAALLESMRRKELVEPTGTYWGNEPVHRFHHVLIRDAAYRRLLKTTRAELHERVAVWTDRTAADLVGEHEAATAFHYEQAYRYRTELGTVDDETVALGRRAAELLTTAAQRALGRDDLASAGALSARALGLLPASDAAARADLLQTGCECLLASGNGAAAKPLVEELEASAGDDPRLAAWAECYAAQLVGLTDPEGLVAADARAQAAAEALTELGDGSGQAKAHQVRAGLLARLGRVGDAELELDLALAAARAADDRRRVTAVLGAAPDAALFGPSPVARAGGRCLDVVRLLRITTASPAVEAASNRCQAVLESLRGRFDVSRSMLASARAALEELGLRHGIAQTELYAGMVEMIAGDPHAAIPPLRAAYEGLGTLGVGADAGQAAALLAIALLAEGEVDEAELMAAESEALAGQNLKTAIGWRVARAEVLAARGDLAGGVALAEEAVEIAAGTDLVIDHADACVALASLRARAGDAAGARSARADAQRLYEQKGATVPADRLDQAEVVVTSPQPDPVVANPPAAITTTNRATRLLSQLRAAVNDGLVSDGGDEALIAELVSSDYQLEDRRSIVSVTGIDENLEDMGAAIAQGYVVLEPEVIAVRGERLCLCRVVHRTAAGDENVRLSVNEFDVDDRHRRTVIFDADAFADAAAELDAWYLAGEGAEQADAVRPILGFLAAFNARDWDGLAASARDYESVDHRGLWPNAGPDAFVERMRSLVATAPDATVTARQLLVGDVAFLVTADVRATAAQRGRHDYTFHVVGRPGRFEYFDEQDLAAALARFEALSASGERSEPSVVGNRATTVHTRVIVAIAEGDDRTLTDLVAPEFEHDDRRSVVNMGHADRREAARSLQELRAQGFEWRPPIPVAVRGERLGINRSVFVTDAGDDNSSLAVFEIDAQDRLLSITQFDHDALDAAIEELDARYLAGEGAEHAELVATNAAFFRALNHFDLDAMRGLAGPGFVYVDHRSLGTPPLDIEAFIGWQEGYRGVENHALVVDIQVRGRVDLVTAVNRAVDVHGGEIHWPFLVVGVVGADGRVVRTEVFAPEDRDAALARFEELSGTTPSGLRVENNASRTYTRVMTAINAGADHELANLVSSAYRVDDRKPVVNLGAHDLTLARENFALFREQGWQIEAPRTVAVRGERLALNRVTLSTAAGDEAGSLELVEVDEQGRLWRETHFGDDELAAAIEELDARYLAGEGAPHARVFNVALALANASERRDTAVLAELVAPDFEAVDHRRIGYGEAGSDEYLAATGAGEGLYTVASVVWRSLLVAGDVVLAVRDYERRLDDGGAYATTYAVLLVVGRDDRATRLEFFDLEDWGNALARLEELSARSTAPPIENAATRAFDGVVTLATARRFDEFGSVVAADFERIDRRTGVSAEPVRGPDAWAIAFRSTIESGMDRLAVEHLAVRGDRLVLDRLVFRSDAGDEIPMLAVIEVNASGLLSFIAWHDEDALEAAAEQLDARYVAGEGAEHAGIFATGTAWFRAMSDHDLDALRELVAPGVVFVDHRVLGAPALDLDGFLEWQRSYADVAMRILVERLRIEGRVGLVTVRHDGVDRHGGSVEWGYNGIGVFDGESRYLRSEMFSDDDWDAALARFEELSRGSGDRPPLENTATRTADRLLARLGAGRVDEVDELLAPGMVSDDRRSGVSWGRVGRDELLEGLRASREVGLELGRNEVIAVRGDRLTLGHVLWRTAAGDEISQLSVGEVDPDGRCTALVTLDDDRLDEAIAELEERYLAGEGAEHADVLRAAARVVRAFDEDPDALVDLCAPDFTLDDHRRLMYGTGDRDHLVSIRRASPDDHVRRTVTVNRRLIAQGRAVLALQDLEREDPDGAVYRWTYCTLASFDGSWRLRSLEWFDEDAWDAALARFDELSASDPRTPRAENSQTRAAERFTSLINEGRWDEASEHLVPDVVRIDHRPGVSAEPTVGPEAYVAATKAAFDVGFVRSSVEHLAVRGERLALTAATLTTDTGTELGFLIVGECDAEGRISFLSLHDPDDLDAALAELDERYLAGEGADHADVLLRALAVDRAFRADPDAAAAMFAPGFVFDDRRRLQYGDGDLAHLTAARRASDATGLDVVATVNRKAFVAGRTILTVQRAIRRAPDGRDFEWTAYLIIAFDPDLRLGRLEYHDEDDWDAALARFDELSNADLRTPKAENTASRTSQRVVDLTAAGRYDEATALFRPDFERFDRRRTVAGPTITSGAEYMASFRAILDQFDAITIEPVAVRGNRLHLSRTRFSTESGFETVFWHIAATDDTGLICWIASHDEEDLDAALAEMDERYLAGEGAEHADVLRAVADFARRHTERDWTGVRALIRADTRLVDHRRFGWPSGDRDVVVRMFRELVEMVPDHRLVYRNQHVAGRAVLTTLDSLGTTRDGGAYEWVVHSLSTVDAAGRITSFELFDEADWDAALARLDELGATPVDSRTPAVENAWTSMSARFLELTRERRFDEAGRLLRRDLERIDHRSHLAYPPIRSAAEYMAWHSQIFDQFDTIDWEPIAVRGERLGLSLTSLRAAGGFESVFLMLGELDDQGLSASLAIYDLDDLDAALAELDDRYLAGEGAAHAAVLRSLTTTLAAMHSGDYATLAAHASPQWDYVDHRRAAFGALDAVGFVAMAKSYDDVDRTSVLTKVYFGERSLIARLRTRGVAADGVEVEWVHYTVFTVDESGRALHGELFADDDWDAALARFDELCAAPVAPIAPGIGNTASRVAQRLLDLTAADRYDEAEALFRPDFQRIDRRRTVAAPPITSAAEYLDSIRAILGLFDGITTEAVVIRGESLYLSRSVFTRDGFETMFWAATELDADGRLCRIINYDEDDFAAAVALLDEWYLEGLGAEEAFTIRRGGDFVRSMASLDGAATLALVHPDVRWSDHRRLGFGTAGFDGVRDFVAARAEDSDNVEDRSYFRDLTVRGPTMKGRIWSAGIRPDGEVAALYEFHWVARWVAGRMHEIDWFDLADADAARARFEELAAAPPPAVLDNACLAACIRGEWLAEFGFAVYAVDAIAPDIVAIDHRRGTGQGFRIEGREAYVANQVEIRTNIDAAPRLGWLAVRGERYALAKWIWTSANDFEIAHLGLMEIDGDGRICRNDQFDVEDLDAAVAALDAWYVEGEGAEHAERLRSVTRGWATIASGDTHAVGRWPALVAPEFAFVDRRHAGWGSLDVDGLVEMQRSFVDVEQSILLRRIRFGHRATLSTVLNRGVDPDGGEAEWRFHAVSAWDTADRVSRLELFDDEAWDAARARFDALNADSPPSDARTLEIENTATRSARLSWRLLPEGRFDELPAVAPGFSLESRHRFLRLPEEQDWLDALMLLIEQYSSFVVEPLAIRGARAAVVRVVASDGSGNESAWIATLQLDESDRWVRQVNFDEEDETAAIDLLDEWYIEGEGAADAEVLTAHREGMRRYHAHDWDWLRANGSADFEFVDHRPLPWPTSDAEGLIRLMSERVEQVPDVQSRIRKLFVRARAILSVGDVVGTDEHGGLQQWPVITVYEVDTAGLNRRIEYFALEQWEAALARFDELAVASVDDARTPEIVNASTRALDAMWAAALANRFDDLAALLAPAAVRDDRRKGVAAAPMNSDGEYLELLRSSFADGQVRRVDSTPLAVRGDRLSLSSVVSDVLDFEIAFLILVELDAEGRIVAVALFDENDLAAAIDELDDRFLAGEGAPDARVLSVLRAAFHATRDEDTDALGRLLSPALVTVDHQRIGLGTTTDRDAFLERGRSDQAVMRRDREYPRKGFVSGGAVLVVYESERLDPYGGEVLYQSYFVARADASDRIDRMEWFDLDDWDAAVARFDELAAESPADPRHPRAENAATRLNDRYHALLAAGRIDEGNALIAPEFALEDHRRAVSLPDVTSGDMPKVVEATRDVGFTSFEIAPLAVRGDQLTLGRGVMATADGFEVRLLVIDQLGADGRAIGTVYFEEDDLAAALEELDARYVASGLATDAEAQLLAGTAALNRRDYDALTALLAPEFVSIDHSPLGFPPADRLQLIHDQMAGLDAMVPDNVRIPVKVLSTGDMVLAVTRVIGTTTEGSTYEWVPIFVAHSGADGLVDRMEFYAPEDWDAALARFDELAAEAPPDPRHPRAENAMTRLNDRYFALVEAGRTDEGHALVAQDYVREDRRTVVALPDASGDEIHGAIDAARDVGFTSFRVTPIAVRGDRLTLGRGVMTTADGFEVCLLVVDELGADGRAIASVYFDEDALAAALEELDARYVASAEATDVEREALADTALLNRRDYAAFKARLSPEFVLIDHSPLGFPPADRDAFTDENLAGLDGIVPDNVKVVVKLIAARDGVLMVNRVFGTTTEGNEYEWAPIFVCHLGPDGLIDRIDAYTPEDWDAALARFDELAASVPDEPASPLENAAVRCFDEMVALANARDADGLRAWTTPEFTVEDRRSVVAGPTTAGEEFVTSFLDGLETFDSVVTDEVVAIRGDRLVLTRTRWVHRDGFDVPLLAVSESGADGRPLGIVTFDSDDLSGAFGELEDRYVAGEGAADAYVIRRLGDYRRAYGRRDWDAITDLCAPDLVAADHRLLPYPLSDRGSLLAMQQGAVELVPDVSLEVRTLEVSGDALLSRNLARGTSGDGSQVAWEYWNAGRFVAGRIASCELFDIDDEVSARARFDGLAAVDPRTPVLDNEGVRLGTRHAWWLRHDLADALDQAVDLMAPDLVQIDRRKGVSQPDIVGRDERLQVLGSFVDVFRTTDITVEYLAVRGDRLALNSWRVRSGDGSDFELTGLDVTELDAEGRQCRIVTFDEDDFAGALAELEHRHEQLSGVEYSAVERTYARASLTLTRGDMDAWLALQAPDLEMIDHSPAGGGQGGVTETAAYMAEWRTQTPDLVNFRKRSFVAGDRMLSALALRGTTPEGNRYEWDYASVVRVDAAGRIAEEHFFPIEQWEDARALFDERLAEATGTAAAPAGRRALQNRATRHAERFVAMLRADPGAIPTIIRPDYTYVDRRWGGVAPAANGPDEFVDHLRAGTAAGFVRTDFEVLAVRGESLAVSRWTSVSDAGDASVHLALNEVDARGLATRTEMFEPGDLAPAVARLDECYLEGEGAGYAWMIGPSLEFWGSYNARAWDRFRGVLADEIRNVDHRLVGAGATLQTADQFVAYAQGLIDLVPDVVAFEAEYLAIGRVWALTHQQAYGTSVDGAEIERPSLVLAAMRGGRFTDSELFEPEQRAEALARFEELESTELVNRATAAGERARAAALRGDRAATLDAFAPKFRRIEGRPRAISGERVVGRDLYVDGMLAGPDAGLTHFDADVLETVGDDHALTHVRWHNDAGSVQEWLFVGEVDDSGRLCRIANFDPDDRAAASALLHTWASGPPQSGDRMSVAAAVRNAALDRGDRDAVLATYTPDFVREDHRRGMNFGTSDREETVDALLAGNDVGLGSRSFTTVEVVDDEHTLVDFRMSHTDGFEVVYLLALESDEEGRLRRAANFDLDDRERASTLLREWAHGPAPARAEPEELTNAAVRKMDELAEAFAAFDWAGYHALWAGEPVSEDRRTGVNSGVTRGRVQMVEFGRSLADVGFTSVAHEPVAIRGDRLALLRRTWRRPDRFELPVLVVVELDADGLYAANVMFDPEDLESAIDELERRYLMGDGAEHERFVRTLTEFWRCYNARDRDGMRAYLTDDYRLFDHRPASAGTSIGSADEFLDYMQGLVELAPDMFALPTSYLAFGERWCLYRESVTGTSTAGAEVRLEFVSAAELVDGVFAASEVYLPEQLAEAWARFEEVESEGDGRTQP